MNYMKTSTAEFLAQWLVDRLSTEAGIPTVSLRYDPSAAGNGITATVGMLSMSFPDVYENGGSRYNGVASMVVLVDATCERGLEWPTYGLTVDRIRYALLSYDYEQDKNIGTYTSATINGAAVTTPDGIISRDSGKLKFAIPITVYFSEY